MAITNPPEPELIAVLKTMIADLDDPTCHYTVFANYYDHLTEGREGERWYLANIWFNKDTTQHIVLTDEGLAADVFLNRHDRDQVSRILLPFDQIWNVQLVKGAAGFDADLYYRGDKLNLNRPTDED